MNNSFLALEITECFGPVLTLPHSSYSSLQLLPSPTYAENGDGVVQKRDALQNPLCKERNYPGSQVGNTAAL